MVNGFGFVSLQDRRLKFGASRAQLPELETSVRTARPQRRRAQPSSRGTLKGNRSDRRRLCQRPGLHGDGGGPAGGGPPDGDRPAAGRRSGVSPARAMVSARRERRGHPVHGFMGGIGRGPELAWMEQALLHQERIQGEL